MSNRFLGFGGLYLENDEDLIGEAKGTRVDKYGNLTLSPVNRVKKMGSITIPPKDTIDITLTPYSSFVITGRLTSEKSPRVDYSDLVKGGRVLNDRSYVTVKNSRFSTGIIVSKADKGIITLYNNEDDIITISDLFMVEQSIDNSGNYVKSDVFGEGMEVISPGETKSYYINNVFKKMVVGGRISGPNIKLTFDYVDVINSRPVTPWEDRKRAGEMRPISGGRFLTNIIYPRSDEIMLYITNDSTADANIGDLIKYSVEGNNENENNSNILVMDENGEPINITAVKDNKGNGVLRIVDAAPRAYDAGNDVLRTMQMNAPMKKHKTIQLVWLDSSLTGKTFAVDLKNNKELLQGEKGYLFYQGIDDDHDIYLNYRIGGSGNYVKKHIVERGSGASNKENALVTIPDECFPFLDLSITPQASTGISELVFETKTGNLTGLRAYLVIM